MVGLPNPLASRGLHMCHRKFLLLGSLVLVLALLIAGSATIYAAVSGESYDRNSSQRIEIDEALTAIEDYFDGDLTQREVVDVFLHYFGSVPMDSVVTPAPTRTPVPVARTTPTPAPTPTPTATPAPTPSPPLYDMLECRSREHGWLSSGVGFGNIPGMVVVEQVLRDIDVTFINPSDTRERWSYGFALREVQGPYRVFMVNYEGYWVLRSGYLTYGLQTTINSGYLDVHGIPFNLDPGGRNQLTIKDGGRVFINGVKLPTFKFPLYGRYKSHRSYRLLVESRDRIEYENLCTVDSWSE